MAWGRHEIIDDIAHMTVMLKMTDEDISQAIKLACGICVSPDVDDKFANLGDAALMQTYEAFKRLVEARKKVVHANVGVAVARLCRKLMQPFHAYLVKSKLTVRYEGPQDEDEPTERVVDDNVYVINSGVPVDLDLLKFLGAALLGSVAEFSNDMGEGVIVGAKFTGFQEVTDLPLDGSIILEYITP